MQCHTPEVEEILSVTMQMELGDIMLSKINQIYFTFM